MQARRYQLHAHCKYATRASCSTQHISSFATVCDLKNIIALSISRKPFPLLTKLLYIYRFSRIVTIITWMVRIPALQVDAVCGLGVLTLRDEPRRLPASRAHILLYHQVFVTHSLSHTNLKLKVTFSQ